MMHGSGAREAVKVVSVGRISGPPAELLASHGHSFLLLRKWGKNHTFLASYVNFYEAVMIRLVHKSVCDTI